MKLAIISDTHFGDPDCGLVGKSGGAFHLNWCRFKKFADQIGADNDFLVMVGDVFDFSISSYAEAYSAAKLFFDAVQNHHLANDIF